MELSILYAIPRTAALDNFFLDLTKVVGSYGQLCVILGIVLLCFRKTRKMGAAVLVSYVAVFLVGQLILKNLVSRPRPCQVDPAFPLLIAPSASSSFPSTHTGWAFGTATAIFLNDWRFGIAAYIYAFLIAYSRLYLFAHFPTDVLAGAVVGIVLGTAAARLVDRQSRESTGTSHRGRFS